MDTMINLTRKQAYEAVCGSLEYLAFRDIRGFVIGVNCKVVKNEFEKLGIQNDSHLTNFIGFYPIGFHEYISLKVPFL